MSDLAIIKEIVTLIEERQRLMSSIESMWFTLKDHPDWNVVESLLASKKVLIQEGLDRNIMILVKQLVGV